MINVYIQQNNEQIIAIKVSGHADSAEYGKDLVCAGVTTVCVGIANALAENGFLKNKLGTIGLNKGICNIQVKQYNEKIQIVLEIFVTILRTVEESQPQYIKIKRMEV